MIALDALRAQVAPYMLLIRIALYGVLAAFLFVSGCRMGEHRQQGKVDTAKVQLTTEKARADGFVDRLNDVNKQTEANLRASEAAKAAAEEQAKQADKDTKAAQAKAKTAQQALDAARKVPKCRAQLEMELCADIPLL